MKTKSWEALGDTEGILMTLTELCWVLRGWDLGTEGESGTEHLGSPTGLFLPHSFDTHTHTHTHTHTCNHTHTHATTEHILMMLSYQVQLLGADFRLSSAV